MSIMSPQAGTDSRPTRPEFLFQVQLYCRVFFEVRHISKKKFIQSFSSTNFGSLDGSIWKICSPTQTPTQIPKSEISLLDSQEIGSSLVSF